MLKIRFLLWLTLFHNLRQPSMHSEAIGIPEISLRQLKSALYVSRYNNVTKAARQLNRSQTAITKAINDLEQSLGKPLFDRSSTGVTATVYGEALAHRMALAAAEFELAGNAYREVMPPGRHSAANAVFSLDISYKRLAAFIALFETHNIGRAAGVLGVTKAAVYNSVRQLEELLGLSLFERSPGSVTPTPFCQVLARHLKLAFAEIRHAIADLASLDGVTRGRVAIGTLPYTRTYLTPRAVNQLLESHPQLDVATQEGPYNALETALRSGDIDFIVGAVRPVEEGTNIAVEVLFEDRLAVIARKNHPLAAKARIEFADLLSLPWVLPSRQTPAWQLFEELLKKQGMKAPQHAVYTSSLSMVRGLLLDSDRVALLSEHQIYYDQRSGLLDVLPVELPDTYRPIGVTMRANTLPSPAAQLFLNNLRAVAEDIRVVT